MSELIKIAPFFIRDESKDLVIRDRTAGGVVDGANR